MKNEIKLGDAVRHLENLRTGNVEEIRDLTPLEDNELFKKFRYRVRWTKESDGHPVSAGFRGLKNGIRTWCQRNLIELI